MSEPAGTADEASHRARVVAALDTMVAAGRVTDTEAAQVRAASEPGQFEKTLGSIRARHAGAKLAAAVQGGHMTQDEADVHLERLKKGEHPKGLRSLLRRIGT